MWIDDFFNLFMKNLKVIWYFKNKGLIKYNQWNNTKLIPNKKSTKTVFGYSVMLTALSWTESRNRRVSKHILKTQPTYFNQKDDNFIDTSPLPSPPYPQLTTPPPESLNPSNSNSYVRSIILTLLWFAIGNKLGLGFVIIIYIYIVICSCVVFQFSSWMGIKMTPWNVSKSAKKR